MARGRASPQRQSGGQSVEAEAGHKRQRGHHNNGRQVGNRGGASAKGNATNGTDGSRRTAASKEEAKRLTSFY